MITQFSIGFSRTINLGNFQSARVEASITVAVDNETALGVSEREAYEAKLKENAQVELRALLEETYRAQHLDRQKPDERAY